MFSLPQSREVFILQGEYSVSLVVLSIVIACCAAYTALSMNQRMKNSSFFHKNFWLLLASIAMGLGIWSMHFIGMSAFMLPIKMAYHPLLTVVSIVPAVVASYLAFFFSNRLNNMHRSYLFAGIFMGLGISSMHYIGMSAMEMEAEYVYKPLIFGVSIAIAIVVSYIALYTFSTLQKFMGNQLIKISTAILMGLAITSMHYTGMEAVVFYTEGPRMGIIHQMHHMDTLLLIIVVTVGISLLLLISSLTGLLDRYVDHRLRYFDALTLLPNQRQFEKDLKNMASPGSLAIVHIHNIEKWITGQGYTFWDEMVKAVGSAMERKKPEQSKVFRIEGNRFAVLSYGKSDFEKMKASMSEMMSFFKKPFTVGDQPVVIEMVCAISRSENKKDVREIFSNSMAVLQHPSTEYKHELVEYDPWIHTYSFERQIVQDIHQALKKQELFIEYQPKVCSQTYELSGLEALLRWNHPVYGMLPPGVFIQILEENEEIFKVTDWVIEVVCRQIAVWVKEGVRVPPVSINIPGPYVTSTELLRTVKENVLKYEVDSRYLELEITETSVIDDIEKAINAVSEFRSLGLSVALDDFGTGLSSLSYLKRIPISTIKIDKSFVQGVPQSEKDADVLKGIITLCSSLHLQVVIEGVEYEEQMQFIQTMNENLIIQGYYFSRPLAATEIINWMEKW